MSEPRLRASLGNDVRQHVAVAAGDLQERIDRTAAAERTAQAATSPARMPGPCSPARCSRGWASRLMCCSVRSRALPFK